MHYPLRAADPAARRDVRQQVPWPLSLLRMLRRHAASTPVRTRPLARHRTGFSERAFRHLLEAAPDAIVIVDRAAELLLVNSQTEALFGYARADLIGKELSVLLPERFRAAHAAHMRRYLAEPRMRPMGVCLDLWALRSDGSEFPVEVSLSPMGEGDAAVVIATIRDVTDRKRAEEQRLQLARAQAAQASAEAAQAELARLNARLRRAMMETHHRVKNNLQTIAAMVDLEVLDDQDTVPAEALRRLGRHITTLATVHDILTHDAHDEERQVVSAQTLLGRLVPLLNAPALGHAVDADIVDLSLNVRQGTALAVVVNELVTNAIKHGATHVRASLAVAGSLATLLVADDGPGFPEGFDPLAAANTGLELVVSLSRWDLRGDIACFNGQKGGGCVQVSFPVPV